MNIAVITMLLLAQSPTVSNNTGDGVYWKSAPWTVYKYSDEDTCDIGNALPNGEYLSVQYHPKDKFASIMMTNKSATSLADEQRVNLDIVFFRNKEISGHFQSVQFTARKHDDYTVALISQHLDTDFLNRMAQSDTMGLFTNKSALVGAARLVGSAQAVSQLKTCAFEAAELNPNDPFLKE